MKRLLPFGSPFVASFLILALFAQSLSATCGGGGGGGKGGVVPSGPAGAIYRVPWKTHSPSQPLPKAPEAALLVLWFPVALEQTRTSPLISSSDITLVAARGVADVIVAPDDAGLRKTYKIQDGREAVVLATVDGKEIGCAVAEGNAPLEPYLVVDLIFTELEKRGRQFYTYEQFGPVRAMEMKEAREDYMFTSLHKDPAFDALTKDAKNAWMIGREFCAPDQLVPLTAPPGPRSM